MINTQWLTVGLLPLENISNHDLILIKSTIEEYYKLKVITLSQYNFPKNDSLFLNDTVWSGDCLNLLETLKKNESKNDFLIGVTKRPIKATIYDTVRVNRGMGKNGVAVISTFKIKLDAKNENDYKKYLAKIALHEFGHILGLGHCLKNGKCFMIGVNDCKNCNDDVKYSIRDIAKLYKTENKLCQSCQNIIDKKIQVLLAQKKWKK